MKPGFYLLYEQTKRPHLPPSSNEFQPFLFSLRDICDFDSYISYRVICARWRKMSNFLGFPRKIVLFVLNCKNLKILRDFCDFGSYISYGGSLRAERPARGGFAVAKENHHPRSSSFHSRSISASRVCCPSVR